MVAEEDEEDEEDVGMFETCVWFLFGFFVVVAGWLGGWVGCCESIVLCECFFSVRSAYVALLYVDLFATVAVEVVGEVGGAMTSDTRRMMVRSALGEESLYLFPFLLWTHIFHSRTHTHTHTHIPEKKAPAKYLDLASGPMESLYNLLMN